MLVQVTLTLLSGTSAVHLCVCVCVCEGQKGFYLGPIRRGFIYVERVETNHVWINLTQTCPALFMPKIKAMKDLKCFVLYFFSHPSTLHTP